MIETIRKELEPVRKQILEHELFSRIKTAAELKVFMEHHVFAVWDFMTLLKSLQARLTCVKTPWVPTANRMNRRLINEIVLGEESDEHPNGGYASHFELYCEAMTVFGADVKPVENLVRRVAIGGNIKIALGSCGAPEGVKPFVQWTLDLSERPVHLVAAAFTFGREDLVPDLFREVVKGVGEHAPEKLTLFQKYLERHIDLDENTHTPLALKMLEALCGKDELKWAQVRQTAQDALVQRKKLWDAVNLALSRKH